MAVIAGDEVVVATVKALGLVCWIVVVVVFASDEAVTTVLEVVRMIVVVAGESVETPEFVSAGFVKP